MNATRILLLNLIFMLVLISAPARTTAQPAGDTAPPSYNVERIGHLGGTTAQVIIQGQYAYIGRGTDLVIVDLDVPSQPHQVGRITLPDYVNDIAIAETRAYVADGTGGLQIINIQNPSAPAKLGAFATSDPTIDIAVTGGRAFLATQKMLGAIYPPVGLSRLYTLDVGNPAAPTVIDTIEKNGYLDNLIISGANLYATISIPQIISAASSLLVFDIAGAPQPIGSVDFGGFPNRL